jgi:hypothetical protein
MAGGARYPSIDAFNAAQEGEAQMICLALRDIIDRCLPDVESRIWHSHPVWFIDGNPIVGYSKLKGCVRLLFWSGRGFQTPGLHPEGTFQAAEARYTAVTEIDAGLLERWLAESRTVQWDYQHIRTRGLVRIG